MFTTFNEAFYRVNAKYGLLDHIAKIAIPSSGVRGQDGDVNDCAIAAGNSFRF